MDVIDITQAVNKVLRKLFKSGQVGRTEPGKTIFSVDLTNGEFDKNPAPYNLEVGKKYIVKLDSGNYEAVCREYIEENIHGKWLGNMTLDQSLGSVFDDTGENFVIYWLSFGDDSAASAYVFDSNKGSRCTLTIPETIHPIDPKFIPAFDSITLNGADGKQYKLSVDESGTLVHTAIEGA